jgi:hypothetical protein
MLKIEDLKEGVVLVNDKGTELEIQGVIGKIILTISNTCSNLWSIDELNNNNYTIKPEPVKHYLGFPIGNYEGQNIIVSVNDCSLTEKGSIELLKEVTEFFFIDNYNCKWKYAVLIKCNNHNFKLVSND